MKNKELAGFAAVVILPWSPESCMLRHLFKMRVPLFIPHRDLLRNMVHSANRRLLPYPYGKPAPWRIEPTMKKIHPYDPFWDTDLGQHDVRGLESRIYWTEYSEYLLLPELQHFESTADLLVQIHDMDCAKISAMMRNAYLHDLREMRSFFHQALTEMVRKVE
eukprot:gnl/TRDRNA2_/TRDRNA2_152797_c1_seq2.p2 gnl/TRDRNA2_/TRDRNA2_152797_c1~~gnl/TRDRNA2_/TRDRNA2_152797_c1_seq2.p2  ORF type:complete len:163 (+),score=18.54 gnl/TRDRNA2_/TRDRNA2_152797_c1_seq2:81-569(+)